MKPAVSFLEGRYCAFRICGVAGLAAAIVSGMGLALHRGLSPGLIGVLALSSVGAFLIVALITKVIVGEERLTYYHYEILILFLAALLLRFVGQPVLQYLDITLLGIGTVLAFGRIGCFIVGCCHGRPCRWGVRYRVEHADAGFPDYLVGVRLFPVQLIEFLDVFVTVAVGMGLVIGGSRAGEAVAWYTMSYGSGRFGLEFLRGDPARLYWRGVSEAQWTTALLMLFVCALEAGGVLPLREWHLAVTAVVILVLLGCILRDWGKPDLLQAPHLNEIAELTRLAVDGTHRSNVGIGSTSLGLHISASGGQGAEPLHIALSRSGGDLDDAQAGRVAKLIGRLLSTNCQVRPACSAGVFHLHPQPRS